MVAHTLETFGRLDYAVNNAGIEGQFAGVVDLPEEEWDRVLDINLKGTFLCLKYEAPAMLAGGHGGAIVNVGSINSFLGFPSGAAYVSSKHGLIGLTTSVSAELAPLGIRVNLVCPGIIDTPMHQRAHRRRDLRQFAAATCSHETRRTARGDRQVCCLPLLRRGELHHGHHAYTRWRLHSDDLTG